jgi:hypothetical protein
MKTDTGNPLARSPIHLLHRAHQAVGQIFTIGMQTNGLTARQLAVLVAVVENEGLSQTDLVERTGIDRSTVADIVKRLKGKGLLQRKRTKEDARAYAVKLSPGCIHYGIVQSGQRSHPREKGPQLVCPWERLAQTQGPEARLPRPAASDAGGAGSSP